MNDNTQALNTGWMTVKASSDTDLAAAIVLLNTARKEASNTSRSQFIRSTSYQEQFLFNINSRTGLVKEKTRSFRAYLKNVGDGTILRYNLSLKCMDSDDEVI